MGFNGRDAFLNGKNIPQLPRLVGKLLQNRLDFGVTLVANSTAAILRLQPFSGD